MDGVFRGVKKRTGPIFHIVLNPLPFEDDDGFSCLGVTMGGDDRTGGKLTQKKTGAVAGMMGKVGKLDSWVGTGFPHGGVGQTNGWKHKLPYGKRIHLTTLSMEVG